MQQLKQWIGGTIGLTAAVGIMVAPAPLAAQADTASASASVTVDLPDARDVIDRYIEALGGRDAILSHSQLHAVGTLSVPAQGVSGDLEAFAMAPNVNFVRIIIPGFGDFLQGYNGEVAWSTDPAQGPMVMEGKMLEQSQRGAEFYSELHDPANFTSIETVEAVEFDGKQCVKLKLVRTSGFEYFEYFDTETGLLVGNQGVQESAMGQIETTSYFREYKEFGNRLYVVNTVQSVGPGLEQEFTITLIDDQVDPAVFERPADIKVLIGG